MAAYTWHMVVSAGGNIHAVYGSALKEDAIFRAKQIPLAYVVTKQLETKPRVGQKFIQGQVVG